MSDQDRKRKGKEKMIEYEEDPEKRAGMLAELHGGGGDADRPARAPGPLRIPGPADPGQNAQRSAVPVPNQPHQCPAEGQLLAAAPGALRIPGPANPGQNAPRSAAPVPNQPHRRPEGQLLAAASEAVRIPGPAIPEQNAPCSAAPVPNQPHGRPGLQQPPQAPSRAPILLPNSREGQRMWWQWVEAMARAYHPCEANRQNLRQLHRHNVTFCPSPIPQDQRCSSCRHNARRINDFPWRHVCPCLICCFAFRVLCLVCASAWVPVPASVGLRPPQPQPLGPQQHPQPPPPVGAGVQQLQNQNQNQNQNQSQVVAADRPVGILLHEPPHIPLDFLCPACRTYPGRIPVHWPQHVCLCDVCRFFGVPYRCRFCPSAQAAASQGGGS